MPYSSPTDLAALDPESGLVRVVIDTPRGSRSKYKFDPGLGLFRLSRILPAGMSFPYDFGAIPATCAQDGDALDVLVLTEAPLFVGCLVNVHLIGVIRARQREGRSSIRNDRLVGMIVTPVNKPTVRDLKQLSSPQLHDIEHFFCSYNQAQGREFEIAGRGGPKTAARLLQQAMRQFARSNHG